MAHEITIDEAYPGTDDYAVKAFCTDSCGWSEDRWHHDDEYRGSDQVRQEAADRDASAAGVEHLLSVQSP